MNAGDRFLRFRILSQLGWGQFGEVYLAENTEANDRPVALKIVRKVFDDDDRLAQAAERYGAELQKRLSGEDPRVTAVYAFGHSPEGELFIEMEYIDGEDLSGPIARRALAPERAAAIALELCEMLDKLSHFRAEIDGRTLTGVVHGDLKPRNIRISTRGEVRVLDFGIAKAISETRTHTQSHWASKPYASPERLETGTVDMRSDLWSVGVLLYQMLSGVLPFTAPTEQIEARIRSSAPPDELPPQVPTPLRDIVFKMLARNPARRYPTAAAAAVDLQNFLGGRGIAAEPHDSEETVRVTPPMAETPLTESTAPSTPPKAFKPAPAPRVPKPAKVVAGLIMALVFVLYARAEYNVWSDAGELRTDLELDRVANLDDAWKRYQDLDARRRLPIPLWRARRALRNRLVAAGIAPILDYRNNDSPSAYENQWKQAAGYLAKALELDRSDKAVKGDMRLCEGHLARIQAQYQPRNSKGNAARTRYQNQAAAKFREAAELLPNTPDPYLGLARLYAYDLNDLERARAALEKARDYGHPLGRREKVQLADGYLSRIRNTWTESRSLRDMPPQEKEYLVKAREDCSAATDLYQSVGVFGRSVQNLHHLLELCGQVEGRIREIEQGPVAVTVQ